MESALLRCKVSCTTPLRDSYILVICPPRVVFFLAAVRTSGRSDRERDLPVSNSRERSG